MTVSPRAAISAGVPGRTSGGLGGAVLAYVQLFAGFFLSAGAAGFFVIEGALRLLFLC
jgi:hypothetical protein